MSNRHIQQFDLLSYSLNELTADNKKGIKAHLELCKLCQDNLTVLQWIVKQSRVQEKILSNIKIDKMYDMFSRSSAKITPSQEERNVSPLKWGMAVLAAGLVILTLLLLPLENSIKINNQSFIIVDGKMINTRNISRLPDNKFIETRKELHLKLADKALVNFSRDARFKIIREEKFLVMLDNGGMNVQTLKKDNLHIKINNLIINPVGTKFRIQFDKDLLIVFLEQGMIEVYDLKLKQRTFITDKKNLFVHSFIKQETDMSQAKEEYQIYYYLGKKSMEARQWKKSAVWLDKYIQLEKRDTREKYSVMYDLAIIYYEKLNNKDKAYYYFKKILNSRYASEFSENLRNFQQ